MKMSIGEIEHFFLTRWKPKKHARGRLSKRVSLTNRLNRRAVEALTRRADETLAFRWEEADWGLGAKGRNSATSPSVWLRATGSLSICAECHRAKPPKDGIVLKSYMLKKWKFTCRRSSHQNQFWIIPNFLEIQKKYSRPISGGQNNR